MSGITLERLRYALVQLLVTSCHGETKSAIRIFVDINISIIIHLHHPDVNISSSRVIGVPPEQALSTGRFGVLCSPYLSVPHPCRRSCKGNPRASQPACGESTPTVSRRAPPPLATFRAMAEEWACGCRSTGRVPPHIVRSPPGCYDEAPSGPVGGAGRKRAHQRAGDPESLLVLHVDVPLDGAGRCPPSKAMRIKGYGLPWGDLPLGTPIFQWLSDWHGLVPTILPRIASMTDR